MIGAAEVRIVNAVGTAVVEIETTDLRLGVETRLLRSDLSLGARPARSQTAGCSVLAIHCIR